MLSRFGSVVLVTALGCSSSVFKVSGDSAAPDDTGTSTTETSVLPDSTSEETEVEAAPPGPCDPEADKTKYCIEVKAAEHPPYDGMASSELGIDGKGKLFVVLLDKDPLASDAKVVKTITYPADGTEMADTSFPVKLQGEVEQPGPFFVVAYFADSNKTRPEGRMLPGDLGIPLKFMGTKPVSPTYAFGMGKVETAPMELKPLRRAKVIVGAKASLKDFSTTVHGDGPVVLGVTDATTISEPSTWLHYAQRGCVDLQIQSGVPSPQIAYFPLFGEGSHNVFVGVVDYSATKVGWPGQGTLITPLTGAGVPKLDLTGWLPSTTVEVTNIAHGATDGTGDLTCP
jgi:hypothetical protein